jgi:hypothetical protein
MLANVQQTTIKPIITAAVTPGTSSTRTSIASTPACQPGAIRTEQRDHDATLNVIEA